MVIQRTDIFISLKPRLQNIIQDIVFGEFNTIFQYALQDCSVEFCRSLFSLCKLESMLGTHAEDVDASDLRGVEMIKVNQMSTRVIFILCGRIYFTDETNRYAFGSLGPGSCFGDISLLLNLPNKFNYLFNEYSDQHLFFLSIDSGDF